MEIKIGGAFPKTKHNGELASRYLSPNIADVFIIDDSLDMWNSGYLVEGTSDPGEALKFLISELDPNFKECEYVNYDCYSYKDGILVHDRLSCKAELVQTWVVSNA